MPPHSCVFSGYARLPRLRLARSVEIMGVTCFCNIMSSISVNSISTHPLATNNATNRVSNKPQATAAPAPRFMLLVVILVGDASSSGYGAMFSQGTVLVVVVFLLSCRYSCCQGVLTGTCLFLSLRFLTGTCQSPHSIPSSYDPLSSYESSFQYITLSVIVL